MLDLSPTLCEPTRPPAVHAADRATDVPVVEARMDLRLEAGGIRLNGGEFSLLQNVTTPVVTATSRGQDSLEINHDPLSAVTTVRVLAGSATVTPENDEFALVTLVAGQEVDVSSTAVSDVRQTGIGVYLPAIYR